MASQLMDDSFAYMMEQETVERDENDPLLKPVKNLLARPESGDTESIRTKMKIQKVPEMFRRNDSSAHYTPMVVSIGPYHHGSKELDGMEETKDHMVADFIKKSVRGDEGFDAAYDRLLAGVVEVHAFWAMRAYDDGESWSENLRPDRLASIMFRDGCFVLEFISYVLYKPESLPMNSHMAALVKRDLFLLENQLPFRVLNSLMESSKKYEGKGKEFIGKFLTHMRAFPPPRRELCRDRVSKFQLPRYLSRRSTNPEKGNNAQVNQQDDTHLLGRFQKKFIKNMELPASRDIETVVDVQEKGWHRYRAAMELKRVGIECEPAGTRFFTDIHFTSTLLGGKLKIPLLDFGQ